MNSKTTGLVFLLISISCFTGVSSGGDTPDWFPITAGLHWEYNVSGVVIYCGHIYSVKGGRTTSVSEIVQRKDGYPVYKIEELTLLNGLPTASGEAFENIEVLYYHVKQDSILIYGSPELRVVQNVILSNASDTGTSTWVCENRDATHSNSIRYLPFSRYIQLPYGNISGAVSIMLKTYDSTGIPIFSSVEYFGWHTGPVLSYEFAGDTADSDLRMHLIVRLIDKYKD